jgi:N-acylneuraminate cytidylyltransferase/CMP-N,N'-diacetyllegionaminic acid synthase
MNIVIIIPARGGSKGLRNKNIKPLLGKPLLCYTIDAARESKLADRIIISTEDKNISKVSREYGIEVVNRPIEYSTDDAPIELALRHVIKYLEQNENYFADVVVLLQANVPIRKKGQIDNVIRKLIDTKADSVVTVVEITKRPEFMKKITKGDKIIHLTKTKKITRQEYKDKLYILDGAVLAIKRDVLMKTENLTGAHVYLGEDIRCIIQKPKYAIEIDEQFDFDVAEGLLSLDQQKVRLYQEK